MLVEAIQQYLAADSGVVASLGTPTARVDKQSGIWPVQAPDEPAVPWIVFSQVSGNPLQTSMQGTGRLQTARIRFTCYGSKYKQAKTLAKAVKAAMLALDGAQAGTFTQICGSWLSLEMDDAEPLPRGTVFATHLDFQINYLDTE